MLLARFIAISLMLMATVSGYSQSERNYPEPCEPFPFLFGISQGALLGEKAYCWMITVPIGTATKGYVDSVFISVQYPTASSSAKNAIHTAHLKRIPFSRDQSARIANEEHLTLEIPAELGLLIGKAWGAALKYTRYQDPKGEGGLIRVLVDGPTDYFAFIGSFVGLQGYYYGKINFLVSDKALLLQNLGYELKRFVCSDINQRVVCLERLRAISNKILAQQKITPH